MTSTALGSNGSRTPQASPAARRLRLLPRERHPVVDADQAWGADDAARMQSPTPGEGTVLILSQDPLARAQVHNELAELMPDASFEELGTFWEALVLAPSSRLVILSGEVDDLSPEELMHALAHRHPDLPVVSLEPAASPAA